MRTPTKCHERRRGAVAVEAAIVYPVFVVLVLGLIIGGVGVFRYLQTAGLAREAARYASVHGASWQQEVDKNSPFTKQILENAVLPATAGMDPNKLTLQVWWIDQSTGTPLPWDPSVKQVRSLNVTNDCVTNSVRVTTTYQWFPELFLLGPFYMKSTCEVPMSF